MGFMIDGVFALALAVYLLASALLHVYGLNCYVMIWLFLRRHDERLEDERRVLERFGHLPDSELPVVTTQLPIYNERNVIARLLQAVTAIDYPRDKHEIQVLDDSTDETRELTSALVSQLRARGHDVHHLHRTDRTGYKAGALAAGLRRARGEFIAIFDADFVPPPDFLRRAIPFLLADPDCGWVQTRWGHRNRGFSLLTRLQSIGIDGHFVVEQAARAWNGLFCNFNGTAGVWRRKAIAAAGGWRADTLTEDLDLSYRVLLDGWRSRYLLDQVTPAELPTNINSLKSQQHRWAKGSIQCALKMLPVIWARRDLSLFHRVQASLHLTHYLIHPLILIITVLILPLALLLQVRFTNIFTVPLLLLMFLALFGPSILYLFAQGVSGGRVGRTLIDLPALMAMGIGLAVNNTRAVLSALRGEEEEFVRTPKLGMVAERNSRHAAGPRNAAVLTGHAAAATGPATCKVYRQPLSRLFVVEIFMGLWALAAFLGAVFTIGSVVGPFLMIQAAGFTYVGVISIMHDRHARKPTC